MKKYDVIDLKVLNDDNGKYSHAVAALFTELSEITYEKLDWGGSGGSIKRYNDLGFPTVKRIENKEFDTQVFILSNNTNIIAVWRGSESKKDWGNNFNFWSKKPKDIKTDEDLERIADTNTKCGRVHRGFFIAMGSVFDEVKDYIQSIPNYRAKSLYTCGHSLGGSCSTLFFRFFDQIIPFEHGYSIAGAMVGKKKFVKNFKKMSKGRFTLIINNADVVPQLPPKVFGFRRAGSLIYITAGGIVSKGTSGWFRFWDKLGGAIFGLFNKNKGAIDDHHPYNYYNPLAKAAGCKKRLQIWKEYRE